MGTASLSEMKLEVLSSDATEEEIDMMTRQLLAELRGMDVEWADLETGGAAPEGAKAVDPITTGSIIMAVLPGLLPRVIEGIQSWALRGSNRTVKFKGRIAGQSVEFEGSGDDLQHLLATLEKSGRRK